MPLFGAHMSIAGGLHKAVEAAQKLEMDTFQIFTHSPSQWAVKPTPVAEKKASHKSSTGKSAWQKKQLTDDEVARFQDSVQTSKLKFPTAHDSYLINLAAGDEELYTKSIEAFVSELERAEKLGLAYLVMHPGAHTGSGEEAGLERVVRAFDEVHARCPGFGVKVLVETTAGQGTTLGWKFEHIAQILNQVREPQRLGVCLDTCHIFAAGYPLVRKEEYQQTFDEFDRIVGLDQIRVFHLNDSVKGLGSRVDRHAGIGLGQIGDEAFRRLVNDPRFADRPMILETPKEDSDGCEMDPINLAKLRGFLKSIRKK